MVPARTPLTLAVFLLAHSSPAFAGGSDGGGTVYKGHLLDDQVRDGSVSVLQNEETASLCDALQNKLVQAVPQFANAYIDFFYGGPTRERFTVTDKLPDTRVSDIKHSVGDRLVGLQRGPIVWVLSSYFNNPKTDMNEKFDFFVHEFLVAQKLKQGPLSERDKDEILNTSAFLSQLARDESVPDTKTIQGFLEKNHFQPGMTNDELKELGAAGDKLNAAVDNMCKGTVPNSAAWRKVNTILNWITYQATDEDASVSKRDYYSSLNKKLNETLHNKRDAKSLCAVSKEMDLEDAFGDSLNKQPSGIQRKLPEEDSHATETPEAKGASSANPAK
jgi:hypothetical protein